MEQSVDEKELSIRARIKPQHEAVLEEAVKAGLQRNRSQVVKAAILEYGERHDIEVPE